MFNFHSPVDIGETLYIVDLDNGEHKKVIIDHIKITLPGVGLICDKEGNMICTTSELFNRYCYRGKQLITTDALTALNEVEKHKGVNYVL